MNFDTHKNEIFVKNHGSRANSRQMLKFTAYVNSWFSTVPTSTRHPTWEVRQQSERPLHTNKTEHVSAYITLLARYNVQESHVVYIYLYASAAALRWS